MSIAAGLLYPEIRGVHTRPLSSRYSSARHAYFNYQCVLGMLHALAPELMCGRSVGWWSGASGPYSTCAASELYYPKQAANAP